MFSHDSYTAPSVGPEACPRLRGFPHVAVNLAVTLKCGTVFNFDIHVSRYRPLFGSCKFREREGETGSECMSCEGDGFGDSISRS
jgi:hypothetical protein